MNYALFHATFWGKSTFNSGVFIKIKEKLILFKIVALRSRS